MPYFFYLSICVDRCRCKLVAGFYLAGAMRWNLVHFVGVWAIDGQLLAGDQQIIQPLILLYQGFPSQIPSLTLHPLDSPTGHFLIYFSGLNLLIQLVCDPIHDLLDLNEALLESIDSS